MLFSFANNVTVLEHVLAFLRTPAFAPIETLNLKREDVLKMVLRLHIPVPIPLTMIPLLLLRMMPKRSKDDATIPEFVGVIVRSAGTHSLG